MALTQKDLQAIGQVMDKRLEIQDAKFEKRFQAIENRLEKVPTVEAIRNLMVIVAQEEIRKVVKEEISHLPTKEEFCKENDKIMTELKTVRQEQTMINVRLERVEQVVGIA